MWSHWLVHRNSPEKLPKKIDYIFLINNRMTIDHQNALGRQEFLFFHVIVAKVVMPFSLLTRVHMCTNMYVLSLEENLWNSIFVYDYHVGPNSQTDVDKLGSRFLYLFKYFTSSHKTNWTQWYLYTYILSLCISVLLVFCLCSMII